MKNRLSGIAGGRDRRIALSLVHRRERIDVALADVVSIEAVADITFAMPGGHGQTFPAPAVELKLAAHINMRLHRLTSTIIDEALDIVVGGKVVASPIIGEPLGLQGSFRISAVDIESAEALAAKLRKGFAGPNLRVVCGERRGRPGPW